MAARGSPFRPRVTSDVVFNTFLWFLVPRGLWGALRATGPAPGELEKRLEPTPEAKGHRARREKPVQVIKPDPKKDDEMRDLLNRGLGEQRPRA